ncbi:MAG TPA: hypothetical protein HA366_00355 [Candidatus Methanomethylophilaceae archaeon]|nr:hypothetical protein [Candidatus Methanomethylophilaceae archaeon]
MSKSYRLPARALAICVTFALMFSLLAVMLFIPFGSEAADNEAPDWQEGDGIALGMELDLLSLYNNYEDIIIENLIEYIELEDVEIEDFSLTTGAISAYILVEVSDVTDSTATITEKIGLEIELGVSVDVLLLNLTEPGTYDNITEFDDADTVNVSTTFSASGRAALVQSLSVTFDKETMDIIRIETYLHPILELELGISKMPYKQTNDTTGAITCSMGSLNADATLDVKFLLGADFEPAFKLYDLPIEVDDTWNTSTEDITLNGGLEGVIDLQVSGTSPLVNEINDGIDALFATIAEALPNASGLDGFPINLEEVTIPAEYFVDEPAPLLDEPEYEFSITNGQFATLDIPIDPINMTCGGSNETDILVNLGLTGENTTIYWVLPEGVTALGNVTLPEPLSSLLDRESIYIGGIPYMQALFDMDMWSEKANEIANGISLQIMDMANTSGIDIEGQFSFESMTPSAANEAIEDIDGIETTGSSLVDAIIDLFLESPYYGVIAVVIIVLIAGILLVRRG